jgi:hypothetical protein
MSPPNADRVIDQWLREQLDAVPEPTRAVRDAIDAAVVTPQRRGRWHWLRQLLGLDRSTMAHGRHDQPEIVLTPSIGADQGGASALRHEGAASLPIAVVVVLTASVLLGAASWFTVGPGAGTRGAPVGGDATVPEQPRMPLDPPGPDRVIVVDPDEGHFSTLGGAVAAAIPGDRIELHPGTYQAELVIEEDITIAGVGDDPGAIVVEAPTLPQGSDPTGRLRHVLTLRDSDATLSGFTVRGTTYGTAIIVDGGSPTLDGLVVDPDADIFTGSPDRPHESINVTGRASPIIRDTVVTSLLGVGEGATPELSGVTFEGSCILIEGEGTAPTITDATFRGSKCPGFSISIAGGADATIRAAHIYSEGGVPDGAGIRVANEGSGALIDGSDISGGRDGIFVIDGAEVSVISTRVAGADHGVRVQGADLTLQLGQLFDNGVGLKVSGEGLLETFDNDICDNGQNLDLSDGAQVPRAQNRVCEDGTAAIAPDEAP